MDIWSSANPVPKRQLEAHTYPDDMLCRCQEIWPGECAWQSFCSLIRAHFSSFMVVVWQYLVSTVQYSVGYHLRHHCSYANSVVQALYFCTPFRDLLLQSEEHSIAQGSQDALSGPPALVPVRRPSVSGSADHPIANGFHPHEPPTIPSSPPTLFSALRSLYFYISTNPADSGTVAPRAFIDKVKQGNDIFRSTMHQDAHEFLNYLLNKIVEEIEEEKKLQHDAMGEDCESSRCHSPVSLIHMVIFSVSNSVATLSSKSPPTIITATTSSNSGTSPQDATLVHKLFEGVLTSETRCLTCETVCSVCINLQPYLPGILGFGPRRVVSGSLD